MQKHNLGLATQCVHADKAVEPEISDLAPPLHVATTFRRSSDKSWIYSRSDTPTRSRVEKVLSALEGGYSVTYSSGLSAIWGILHQVKPKRIMVSIGYHGTKGVLDHYQAVTKANDNHGLEILPLSEEAKDVQLLLIETPRNPDASLIDVQKWVKFAKKIGAQVATDCTFLTPLGMQALALGVDFSMHSCTKFLGGHSDVLGGVVSVKTAELYTQLMAGRLIQGAVLGTLESLLLLRSLRTLPLRMERHSSSALIVAKWLESQPDHVKAVWHPALPHHPDHSIYLSQLKLAPACFAFEMLTQAQAQALPQYTELFADATSLGGCESLLEWRYKYDTTLSPCLLRISIGLEDPADLIDDLKQAFLSVPNPVSAP